MEKVGSLKDAWKQIEQKRITLMDKKTKSLTAYPLKDNGKSLQQTVDETINAVCLIEVLNNQWKYAGNPSTGDYFVLCIQYEYNNTPAWKGISLHEVSANSLDNLISDYEQRGEVVHRGNVTMLYPSSDAIKWYPSDINYEIIDKVNGDYVGIATLHVRPAFYGPEKLATLDLASRDGPDHLLFFPVMPEADDQFAQAKFAYQTDAGRSSSEITVSGLLNDLETMSASKVNPSRSSWAPPPGSASPKYAPSSPDTDFRGDGRPSASTPAPGPSAFARKWMAILPSRPAAEPAPATAVAPPFDGTVYFSDGFVTVNATVNDGVLDTVQFLFEDKQGRFSASIKYGAYRSMSPLQPLSYYTLVEAAKKSGAFKRVGPMWIRNSLEDTIEFSYDGIVIIDNERIEPRAWYPDDRAYQPAPGSKRLRGQAKAF